MTTWILLEDDLSLRGSYLELFNVLDIKIIAFETSDKILKWIEDVEVGLITDELPEFGLLDIRVPGECHGLDVAKRIRQSPRLRHMVIIMCSAYPATTQEIIQSGADGFWSKPFLLEKIMTIKEFIERSRPPT